MIRNRALHNLQQSLTAFFRPNRHLLHELRHQGSKPLIRPWNPCNRINLNNLIGGCSYIYFQFTRFIQWTI
jgi:hypothetical protein